MAGEPHVTCKEPTSNLAVLLVRLQDLLERLQPNIKRCETFEEAVQAVAALEAAEAKAQAAGGFPQPSTPNACQPPCSNCMGTLTWCCLVWQRTALHLLYLASEHGEAHSQQRHCCSWPHSTVSGQNLVLVCPHKLAAVQGWPWGPLRRNRMRSAPARIVTARGAARKVRGTLACNGVLWNALPSS